MKYCGGERERNRVKDITNSYVVDKNVLLSIYRATGVNMSLIQLFFQFFVHSDSFYYSFFLNSHHQIVQAMTCKVNEKE